MLDGSGYINDPSGQGCDQIGDLDRLAATASARSHRNIEGTTRLADDALHRSSVVDHEK